MIISIGGNMGSGKSTLAKKLAETLGWPRYYMGGLRREAAAKRGLTLAEYNKLGEDDPQTDLEVDEYQKKLGETEDNFVIEGRTSWHFIPRSLKLYIDVSDEEGARRIFEAGRNGEDNSVKTQEDALNSLKNRKESDTKRYLKYFGVDCYDLSNYDYIIDSTKMTPVEVFDKAYGIIKEQLAQK
jgi:predicted cytidylate kinase